MSEDNIKKPKQPINRASGSQAVRKEMAKRLLPESPIAYSVDGHTFEYESPLSQPLTIGAYVILRVTEDRSYLGQVISQVIEQKPPIQYTTNASTSVPIVGTLYANLSEAYAPKYIQGAGMILGKIDRNGVEDTNVEDIFEDANVEPATDEYVAQYLSPTNDKDTDEQAHLEVGKIIYTSGNTRVTLGAAGLDRHTFLCGQSGSGKTFALGVILEQLLLKTDLRIVVLDPNSDFVRLNELCTLSEFNKKTSQQLADAEYNALAETYNARIKKLRIFRSAEVEGNHQRLGIKFSDLDRYEQAAILKLDPLIDRDEFNAFWKVVEYVGLRRDTDSNTRSNNPLSIISSIPSLTIPKGYSSRPSQGSYSLSEIGQVISKDYSPQIRQLGLRIDNLGIAQWQIWGDDNRSLLISSLHSNDVSLVIDLGTLPSSDQRAAVTMAVLGHLWRSRYKRKPVMLVIDEAHNVCPQNPLSDLERITTELVIQIAGEGRKFGIYLLLATQRPEKLHINVLSQCLNLILMKVNSSSDLAQIGSIFSQVPISLIQKASTFGQGEALITGKVVPSQAFVKFEGRLSHEGGTDIPPSWATIRDHK